MPAAPTLSAECVGSTRTAGFVCSRDDSAGTVELRSEFGAPVSYIVRRRTPDRLELTEVDDHDVERLVLFVARIEVLEGWPLDVEVFTSDLLRAQRTADAIASTLNTTPVLDARLREKSYGVAEGRRQSWLDERFIPPPAVGDRMSHDEGIPGSETKNVVAERIYAAVHDMLTRSTEHVVIVTHGFALTYVISAWLQLPRAHIGYVSFKAIPGSITTLREDDYFRNRQVVALTDTSHLA